MSSPLIQEALRKQEISWGIEDRLTREVDNDSEVQKNDRDFARLERMLLEELKKRGLHELIPLLQSLSECYQGQRMLDITALTTALVDKELGLELLELTKDGISKDEYLKLRNLVNVMPRFDNIDNNHLK